MPYRVTLKKKAIKSLSKINEPYYSNIKEAIYGLADI
jgi:mRNA interferase RelE/StbE